MSNLPSYTKKPLGSLAIARRGITYSAHMLVERDEGLPYVNMKSFKKGGGFNKNGLKFFNGGFKQDDLANDKDLLIANTDVTLDGDIVGIPAYLPEYIRNDPVLFSHHVTRLRLTDEIDAHFLYYLLNIDEYRRWMHKYARGTTVLMLDMQAINKIPIHFPIDISFRLKIVKILSTIDQTIEKTEEIIEKYQQIKTGLMQDLFTRGIGPDSKLRRRSEQAPELYHETVLGWLPIGWKCDTLENVLATVSNNMRSGPFGSALLKSELVEDGIPFLGIDNIHIEKFVPNYKRFVSERKFNELNKYAVRPKDVVITIMGTVGRSAVIPDNIEKALSSKHLWTMTLDADKVIPELICWQLNYASWVKAWFRRETQGGIMDAIQSKTLKELKLPFPPIDEQNEILKRYAAITNKIVSERNKLNKYNKIKAGLMHDLLTGKKTVSTQDDEAVCV
ncbi:restriction endonuclease subunit S [Shewanella sp. H8]|uniref:restriction endonuclease subunit S n=1 Tax=Shewanella sp. H8 TaxID=3342676 RepID=UPI0033151386